MATKTLEVRFVGDNSNLKKTFADTEQAAGKSGTTIVGRFKGNLKKIGPSLIGGLVGGGLVAGLQASLGGAFAAAEESQKIGKETARVIKTTGGAAHVSAKQVSELANSLSEKNGVDDELIQNSANILLTFTKVGNQAGKNNDIFDRAVALSGDMAQSLGIDQKTAALQLGKALNDPIAGVGKLSRAGVSFTAQQKEQIKTLAESGDVLGAQKIILGEVAKEFKGAAEVAATPADKLKVKFENLQEKIGGGLMKAVEKLAPLINVLADHMDVLVPIVLALGAGFAAVKIGKMAKDVGDFAKAAWDLAKKLKQTAIAQWLLNVAMDANPVGAIILGIMALIAAVVLIWVKWDTIWNWIKDHKAIAIVAGIIAWPISMLILLVGALKMLWENWDKIWTWITDKVSKFWEGVQAVWNAVFDFFSKLPGRIIGFFAAAPSWLLQAGKNVLAGLLNGLWSMIGAVADWFRGLPGAIVGWVGDIFGKGVEIGRRIVEGFWEGIKRLAGWLKDKVMGFFSSIWDGVTGLFDITSPSKLAAWAGEMVVRGFAKGIESQQDMLAATMGDTFSPDALTSPRLGLSASAAGFSSSSRHQQTIVVQTVLDGKVVAESVRNVESNRSLRNGGVRTAPV